MLRSKRQIFFATWWCMTSETQLHISLSLFHCLPFQLSIHSRASLARSLASAAASSAGRKQACDTQALMANSMLVKRHLLKHVRPQFISAGCWALPVDILAVTLWIMQDCICKALSWRTCSCPLCDKTADSKHPSHITHSTHANADHGGISN